MLLRQGAAPPCSSSQTIAGNSWRSNQQCAPTRTSAASLRARAVVAAGTAAGAAAATAPAAEAAGVGDGGSSSSSSRDCRSRRAQQQEQQEQEQQDAAIPPRPWAAGVEQHGVEQLQQQQPQQQPDRTTQLVQAMLRPADGSNSGSSSTSDVWDDDFVSGVLAAVAGATRGRSRRGQRSRPLEAADQQQQQVPQEPVDQSRLTAKWQQLTRTPRAADDGSSSCGGQEYYEQQQGTEDTAAGLDTSVQPPRYPHADSLARDVKIRSLLMLLQDDAGAADAPPAAGAAAAARTAYASSSSNAGWGYASGAGVHSCLQRAQWVVEDINRVQYMAWQSSSSNDSSSSSSTEELAAGAGDASQQQQQQQFAAVLSDLHLQLHKLLLAHLTREAPSWQAVARACEDYRPFLNPRLVTGALVALQRQHMQGCKPAPAERREVRDLVWRLLELVWAWQADLGPRECLAVVWSLARLQRARYLQLRDTSQLRDALAAQYQRHLHAQRQQERQAHRQPRRAAVTPAAQQQQQQQEKQQQQQQQELLPLYQHGALLLGFARLGLPAATRLQRGTCDLISKVVYQQLQRERQQLRRAPVCPQQRAQAAAAASHAGLLLYALSELGMTPSSDLLKLAASFSRPLLHSLTPADAAMLAVAFGRFGFVPSASWRKQLLAATGNSAAATIAAAAAAVAGGDSNQQQQQQWYDGGGSSSSSAQQDSAGQLNPADITSLLTAAHSMNADPPAAWVEALLHAALCQLPRCSLQQCVVLLLALQRLQVQPQLQWLLALTQHAVALTGGSRLPAAASSSSSGQNGSSSSSSGQDGSGSSSMESDRASEQQQQLSQQAARQQPVSAAGTPEPDAGGAPQQVQQQRLGRLGQVLPLLKRPERQLQQLEQQQLDQEQLEQQAHQAAQLEQQQRQWLRHVDYPAKHRLCLFLWALGKAVAQLPPESTEAALQQLQPWVAAAARHVAGDMGKLRPLDLVQLLHALAGLRCRPGPGFMAAFASACDAQQAWFTAAMLRQLRDAYAGLGMAPPRSLLVLMLATINSD